MDGEMIMDDWWVNIYKGTYGLYIFEGTPASYPMGTRGSFPGGKAVEA
jgi:hypothetical protein